jgi:hypothetical protein
MSEWIKTAKVGDKVQCVRATGIPYHAIVAPSEGDVCAIREIVTHGDEILLRLDEYRNELMTCINHGERFFVEPAFCHTRFRPVMPRKTDISIFTRLLNTAPAQIPEAV